MVEKILLGIDPNVVPPAIIEAINHNDLVVFLGAGISKLYGLPLWRDLVDEVIENIKQRISVDDSQSLSLSKGNNRERLSLAWSIAKNKGQENVFFECLKDQLSKELDSSKIKNVLKFLQNTDTILTTNADTGVDQLCFKNEEKLIYYLPNRFSDIDFKSPVIVHIHGSI